MNWIKVRDALEELKRNDRKITETAEKILRIPDEDFVKRFPPLYGIQVIHEAWGLRLISPPALPREDNNCWSVIRQMELWKRWFWITDAGLFDWEPRRRFLAETIHHTATPLPFVPNPIETHPIIDRLTSILITDDNLACLDHSIAVENDAVDGQEYCEIRIGKMPKADTFPPAKFNSLLQPKQFENSDFFDEEIETLFSCLSTLEHEEVFNLYNLLLMKDHVIRSDLPYGIINDYYPLRKRRLASVAKYQKTLDKHPLQIIQEGTPSIVTNAPIRSYEEAASDTFIVVLDEFLRKECEWCRSLQGNEYSLVILQKAAKPDGDNLPFDSIFRLLKVNHQIPLNDAIKIRYAPEMNHCVCFMLTSLGNEEGVP